MRKLTVALAGAGMLVAILALSTPASATTGTPETIVLQRNSQFQEIGWSASGTFTDAGSWTSDFRAVGGGPSPNIFNIEIKTTETGSAGTFKMQFQGLENDTVSPSTFGGTWKISSGTGAYATLLGTGTWSLSVDPTTGVRTFTCPGMVHFN